MKDKVVLLIEVSAWLGEISNHKAVIYSS